MLLLHAKVTGDTRASPIYYMYRYVKSNIIYMAYYIILKELYHDQLDMV